MTDASTFKPRRWRGREGAGEPISSDRGATDEVLSNPVWEYQWADSLNAASKRTSSPPLIDRIISEVTRASEANVRSLIFVRGELGIGKSLLAERLVQALSAAARDETDSQLEDRIGRASVIEAGDRETSIDFARRVNQVTSESECVVALARPATLDAAAQWIVESPTGSVTMRTFEPTSLAFHRCLEAVARLAQLDAQQRQTLSELASNLPPYLRTPFYFHQIANLIKSSGSSGKLARTTAPLDLFRSSLEQRIEVGVFSALVECALERLSPESIGPIAGILDREGFLHDGYRNVVLAVAVLYEGEPFSSLLEVNNPLPAIQVILDHLQRARRVDDELIDDLKAFAMDDSPPSNIPHVIRIQSLIAENFRTPKLRDDEPVRALRARCLRLIDERRTPMRDHVDGPDLWWDISDSLALIGDPRLRTAKDQAFAPNSGFFTHVQHSKVEIGSDFTPIRVDFAKPVLPFRRTEVVVGPLWVSNFLVTNELFRDFWNDPERDQFFDSTGSQWMSGDQSLVSKIENAFDVAAHRCFWKEKQEEQSVAVAREPSGIMTILDIARQRALRPTERVALWEPAQSDDRFSKDGHPVVGVTWWESVAFCNWWTTRKLQEGGFPPGSRAMLLTDWEWEAVRRLYYEESTFLDGESAPVDRYPAHLRSSTAQRSEGVHNVTRPLHVGLAPVPNSPGPFDMVGNVWEWTRSRVFGRIVEAEAIDPPFGKTAWDDVAADAEQNPTNTSRDVTSDLNDLSYRAVRGGSFFSVDPQAAWHPAYRLCDPPFSSYFDLGFRFAVYPNGAL